jgi:hypothetical protein
MAVSRKEGDRRPIRVTSDGSESPAIEETKDRGESGSSSGAGANSLSTRLPADESLVLYRADIWPKRSAG